MKKLKILHIILRVLIGIGSLGMIYWYIISRIVSFGSVVGTLFFSIVMLADIFFEKIIILIKKIKKKRIGKIAIEIFEILLAVFVLYVGAALGSMTYAANRTPKSDSTVVVLGCQVRGTEPSQMLRLRLEAAYDYLSKNPDTVCIVSGGQGDNELISEAQCMFNYLTNKKGISPDRIYMEDKSSNTRENLKFSQKIIRENGLNTNMAIVTDWYHEMRAAIIAQKLGYSCGAVPAETPKYLTANFVTREIFAIANEVVFN